MSNASLTLTTPSAAFTGASSLCLLLLAAATSAAAQTRESVITPITPRMEIYPGLSPGGRFVVYSSSVEGPLNLYRLDLTTREILRLTAGDLEDSAASWSPDGSRIVFQREDAPGNRDLWEITADGSHPRNLTSTHDVREQHPRYSPDGSSIIFDSNRAWVEADGSADGIQNYEIYILSLETGALTRVTDWGRWDMYPSFSPDMSQVVWRRALPGERPNEQNFEVFVRNLRTGEERNLSSHVAYDGNPHWSPTGEWIVFVSGREGSSDLFVMRPDGSDLRRVAAGAGRSLGYSRPSFSPDGMRIIANRTVAGVTDIVLIEFDAGVPP